MTSAHLPSLPSHPGSATPQKAMPSSGSEYTCPMHPEVRQPGAGPCPKCGMALEAVAPAAPTARTMWTCPMHPEVRQPGPGPWPKCGMALEAVAPAAPAARTLWTCPMHPEIVRDAPGSCPICGMALEPKTVASAEEPENPELADMTRRFRWSAVLTVPLVLLAMGHLVPGNPLEHLIPHRTRALLELALATPVVLWGGWPFFVRGWYSLVHRALNMFTLIGLGIGVAYVFSVVAAL